jgi:hypothetical protein
MLCSNIPPWKLYGSCVTNPWISAVFAQNDVILLQLDTQGSKGHTNEKRSTLLQISLSNMLAFQAAGYYRKLLYEDMAEQSSMEAVARRKMPNFH